MMSGKTGKVVQWLSKALEAGLKQVRITHSAVIDACAKLRDMENKWSSEAQVTRLRADDTLGQARPG